MRIKNITFIRKISLIVILLNLIFLVDFRLTLSTYEMKTADAGKTLQAGMIDPETGKKIKYWAAPMDPTYIRNEPGKSPMGMDLVPVYEDADGEKDATSDIRIDPVTQQNMGLRLGRVEKKVLSKSIRTFGTIVYDETGRHSVNTKFSGWIEALHINYLGERIEKGQPLFDIYSPELLAAQQEYLVAINQKKVLKQKVFNRMLDASRTRLSYWDLTHDQIAHLQKTGKAKKTVTIYSPATGVVTKKSAVQGQYVKMGENQYEIADLSTIWVDVDIYEYELPWIHQGMSAEMVLAYVPGKRYTGEVIFIHPELDPKTRTVRLRLSFPNPDGTLKPGMYADIYLESTLPGERLTIPHEAVIDSGVRKRVFVSKGKGKFEPRDIVVGIEGNNSDFEVIKGLSEDEEIVISGQFLLDSESRLQEAIAKMLEVRGKDEQSGPNEDEIDMSGMTMDDDLNMDDMTMDSDDSQKPVTNEEDSQS